jgi:hypothetical protein
MFLTLRVRRCHLLDDAVVQLGTQRQSSFLRKLRVVFQGESAVDVGGPSREFLYLVSERLFSPGFGMFALVSRRCSWFAHGLLRASDHIFWSVRSSGSQSSMLSSCP